MKYASTGPKGPPASDHICSVSAGAKQLGVTSASDTVKVSTNLKRDCGNTKRSLCPGVQLRGVNALQVRHGRTDLSECSPDFNGRTQPLRKAYVVKITTSEITTSCGDFY